MYRVEQCQNGVLVNVTGTISNPTSVSCNGGSVTVTMPSLNTFIFSDRRLKKNIHWVGKNNGFNIYEFEYIFDPGIKYRGVIAQEILLQVPTAVRQISGFLAVDYNQLGIAL